jgi:hypothetical protein
MEGAPLDPFRDVRTRKHSEPHLANVRAHFAPTIDRFKINSALQLSCRYHCCHHHPHFQVGVILQAIEEVVAEQTKGQSTTIVAYFATIMSFIEQKTVTLTSGNYFIYYEY